MPLSVIRLKKLLIEGLKYIRRHPQTFQRLDLERLSIQIDAIEQTQTIEELGALATLPTENKRKLIHRHELKTINQENPICMPFGQGSVGWYLIHGVSTNQKNHTYRHCSVVLALFRVELAPPQVVDREKVSSKQAVLWCVSGGLGVYTRHNEQFTRHNEQFTRSNQQVSRENHNDEFYTIPWNMMRGKYQCGSKHNAQSFRFQAHTKDSERVRYFKLSMNRRSEIRFEVNYFTYENRKVMATGHLWNAKSARCLHDSYGGMFWCYPKMNLSVNVKLPAQSKLEKFPKGWAWFDHQFSGMLHTSNWLDRLFLESNSLQKWMWITLQFSDRQCILYVPIQSSDDIPSDMKEYQVPVAVYFSADHDNKDEEKIVYKKNPPIQLKILDTKSVISKTSGFSMFYPMKMTLTDEQKQEAYQLDFSVFGESVSYIPNGNMNWAGNGMIYDSKSGRFLGLCFLECNQFQMDREIISTTLKLAGFKDDRDDDESNDWEIFRPV